MLFLHHVVLVLVICVHYFVSYIEFKHSVNRLLAFEHFKKKDQHVCYVSLHSIMLQTGISLVSRCSNNLL